MPGRVSQYGSGRFLQAFFGLADPPATFYLALTKALPSDVQNGTSIAAIEPPAGGGYARVAIAAGAGGWELLSDIGVVVNVNAISFPTPTADWGKVTHFVLCTAATGGEILVSGSLNEDFYVQAGVTCTIAAGVVAFEMTSVNEPIIV
jgi:hypothetical protein